MKYYFFLILLLYYSIQLEAQFTPQDRAINAVNKYMEEKFNEIYRGYQFGKLYKITPPVIVELELLEQEVDSIRKIQEAEKMQVQNDSLLSLYDTLIKKQVKLIKAEKAYPTYEITHFFVLKEKFKSPILYESIFTLYPDGKIKDVNNLLTMQLTENQYDYFYNYYRHSELYYEIDLEINEEFYSYLNAVYKEETQDKEAVMQTILTTVETMDKQGYYDTSLIAQELVQKWVKNYLQTETILIKYTDLKPVLDSVSGNLLGYSLFAKFKENEKEVVYYFELDENYILRGALIADPKFLSLFE